MNLHLKKSTCNLKSEIAITGSKSETNRLLLLQALYPNIEIQNTSKSDDSEVMQAALKNLQLSDINSQVVDIHHAGTAMRFLTAFFAIQDNKETVLTGSARMHERPIKILVDGLTQLGAKIEYLQNDGFPPLKIIGTEITANKVTLNANVSSQYISALLLIAPKLKNGLELLLEGEITSVPYLKMTVELLNQIGVETTFEENRITVNPKSQIANSKLIIESDWSSASYWYSIVALSEVGTKITLSSYKKNSLQGDAALVEIYKNFGVQTVFNNDNSVIISKISNVQLETLNLTLNNAPDIAQTIAVTSFGLCIECNLYGLHTLKIKETDRLEALKTELLKLGATISVTDNSLHLKASKSINQNISITTYQDHRMAMAFAPLALKVPIIIENAQVVSKSYPTFWEDLKKSGFDFLEY